MTNEQIEEYFDNYKEEAMVYCTANDFEQRLERILKGCHEPVIEQMQLSFAD